MEYPKCHAATPVGAIRCDKCNTPFDSQGATATSPSAEGWHVPGPTKSGAAIPNHTHVLEPGHVPGGRYEILRMLGWGGMGAVYEARDREVDREVALKVIRPDLAGHPDVARQFKQESILGRQGTR